MHDPNAVKIYTDGSAMPNPGCGGIGMVVVFPDNLDTGDYEMSEGYIISTNNRMELKAVIRSFEWLLQNSSVYKFTRAIIITDSDYVHSNFSNVPYWKKDGWRNKDGKPYENQDLWDTFLKVRAKLGLRVDISWAKGKQSDVLKQVDKLAKQGAKNPTMSDSGYSGGKFTASRTKTKKAASMFPADGQTVCIRIYRSTIFGRNKSQIYKVTFDVFDEASKVYTEKYVAYTDTDFDLKRNNCYQVTFNRNPKFAKIVDVEHIEYLK